MSLFNENSLRLLGTILCSILEFAPSAGSLIMLVLVGHYLSHHVQLGLSQHACVAKYLQCIYYIHQHAVVPSQQNVCNLKSKEDEFCAAFIVGCQKIIHEILTWEAKSEVKTEVLHDLKEIGSALYWMSILDIVLVSVCMFRGSFSSLSEFSVCGLVLCFFCYLANLQVLQ